MCNCIIISIKVKIVLLYLEEAVDPETLWTSLKLKTSKGFCGKFHCDNGGEVNVDTSRFFKPSRKISGKYDIISPIALIQSGKSCKLQQKINLKPIYVKLAIEILIFFIRCGTKNVKILMEILFNKKLPNFVQTLAFFRLGTYLVKYGKVSTKSDNFL